MKYLIVLFIFLLIPLSQAETTFFGQGNFFVIGSPSAQGEVVEEEVYYPSGCTTNWTCGSWGSCIEGVQTRSCVKERENCYANVYLKPSENQSCSSNRLMIEFDLDRITIGNSNELSSLISFGDFGDFSIIVDLTYTFFDSSGDEVYVEEESVTVNREEVIRKSFESLNLPNGKYTLVLTAVYGGNFKDEFSREFEITSQRGITGRAVDFISGNGSWYGFGFFMLIVLLVIIYSTPFGKNLIKRWRKKYE
ncbi:MAG: hypothetical protein NUV46_00010 [Nanoarchaeota archaeon]|nr:hypothetical protein [Nanoarchaeota archaeon]